MNNTRIVLVTK